MSIKILDCLKRKPDICIKNIILSQNTAFMWMPALLKGNMRLESEDMSLLRRHQTNFGCVRDQPGLPVAKASFI